MRVNGHANGNSGKRILVVDDDPCVLKAFVTMLRYMGYASDGASNIAHALLSAKTNPPDLVLLDVYLAGGASGGECLEQLRKLPGLANVRIAWVTGHKPVADTLERSGDNPYFVIRKPLDLHEFCSAVERALHWRPHLRNAAPKITVTTDLDRRIVTVNGEERELSEQQRDLLQLLYHSPGRECSREAICRAFNHPPDDSHYAQVVTDRLKEALGPEGRHLIITVHNGYCLVID